MSKMPLSFSKLLLLFLLQGLSYWLFSFNIEFLETVFPIRFAGTGVYFAIGAIHFVAIGLTAFMFCFPVAYLYKEFASLVAFVICFTALVPKFVALFDLGVKKYHPFVYALSVFDGVLYIILLVLFTARVGKYLPRINSTFDTDASRRSI